MQLFFPFPEKTSFGQGCLTRGIARAQSTSARCLGIAIVSSRSPTRSLLCHGLHPCLTCASLWLVSDVARWVSPCNVARENKIDENPQMMSRTDTPVTPALPHQDLFKAGKMIPATTQPENILLRPPTTRYTFSARIQTSDDQALTTSAQRGLSLSFIVFA